MDEQKAVSEAQKRAHRKYMEKFVEIKVRVTPEKRTAIQEHAQTMGESATTFINRAIDHQMSCDRDKDLSEALQGPPPQKGVRDIPKRRTARCGLSALDCGMNMSELMGGDA